MPADNSFGKPGRRADIAQELHDAFARRGIHLLPGRARKIVDERVREVAAQAGISERAAIDYLPQEWAEEVAADVALEQEQAQMAERLAAGDVEISASRTGAMIAGLAVVVQNNVWRVMDDALPASIGEALDCLTSLAVSFGGAPFDISVARAELLAAARLLGGESDAITSGRHTPHDENVAQKQSVAARLAADAGWARRLAQ